MKYVGLPVYYSWVLIRVKQETYTFTSCGIDIFFRSIYEKFEETES